MSWRSPRRRAVALGALRRSRCCAGQASALTLVPPKPDVFLGVSDRGTTHGVQRIRRADRQAPGAAGDLPPLGQQPQRRPTNAGAKPATRPILAISTADDQTLAELITPEQIALGAGDDYLLQLNDFFAKHGLPAYIRPLGEPNRCLNALVGGQLRRHPERRRTHDRLVQAGLPPDRRDRARRSDAWKGSTRPWPKSGCRR